MIFFLLFFMTFFFLALTDRHLVGISCPRWKGLVQIHSLRDMETPQLSGSDTELSGQPRISLEQPYVVSIKSTGLKGTSWEGSARHNRVPLSTWREVEIFETFDVWLWFVRPDDAVTPHAADRFDCTAPATAVVLAGRSHQGPANQPAPVDVLD